MQPAIWTGAYARSPVEEALKRLHRVGWRCVEIATEHLRELRQQGSPGRIAAARAVLDELGMNAPQAHAHLSANFADDDTERRADHLATALEELPICAALGVETVVLHPGWSPAAGREASRQRSAQAFSRLVERAGDLAIRIAVENMATRPGEADERRFGTTIEDLFELIEVVGSPLLGICFDTSHAHIEGMDLPEAVRAAAPRLWALHISDNDGVRDLHLHPFYGTIEWLPFLSALREIRFAEPFNLEIGGLSRPPYGGPEVQDAKCRHALELATLMTTSALEGK